MGWECVYFSGRIAVANLKQVAVLERASTGTVSPVLNKSAPVSPNLRDRVRKVVRELNYQPNSMACSQVTWGTEHGRDGNP